MRSFYIGQAILTEYLYVHRTNIAICVTSVAYGKMHSDISKNVRKKEKYMYICMCSKHAMATYIIKECNRRHFCVETFSLKVNDCHSAELIFRWSCDYNRK